MAELREGPYGRCVWRSDNDVVDHQSVSLEFDGGAAATFSIEGFSANLGRHTRIMGTEGELASGPRGISITRFDGRTEAWSGTPGDGHGGGDAHLLRDFIRAVATEDPSLIASDVEVSIDSHRMSFAAERSRIRRAGSCPLNRPEFELMGYSKRRVAKAYGPSLTSIPVDRKRGFLAGLIFRKEARWIEVD